MITREIIEEMGRRLAEAFAPQRVILFGSCARGEMTVDSDVDLLVVMPVEGNRLQLLVEMRRVLRGLGVPKDVLVVTPEEFGRDRDIAGTISYPAAHEGEELYAA